MLRKIKNRLNELTNVEKIAVVGTIRSVSLETLAEKMQISKDEIIDLQLENHISDEVFSKFCKAFDVPEDTVKNLNEANFIDFVKKYCHSKEMDEDEIDDSPKRSYILPFNPIEEILKLNTKLFLSEREKCSIIMESMKRNSSGDDA